MRNKPEKIIPLWDYWDVVGIVPGVPPSPMRVIRIHVHSYLAGHRKCAVRIG